MAQVESKNILAKKPHVNHATKMACISMGKPEVMSMSMASARAIASAFDGHAECKSRITQHYYGSGFAYV